MNELDYTINQNRKAIQRKAAQLEQYLSALKEALEDGAALVALTDWEDGFVARDVASITAGLARDKALLEAASMSK